MTRTRTLLTVPALLLAFGLGACSGDGEGSPSSDATATEAVEADDPATVRKGCTATVEVTGDVTASWTGKATVRRGEGAPTVYTAEGEDGTVLAYAGAEGFEATANFTDDAGTFTVPPGTTDGVDLDADGSGGTVDAPLVGLDDAAADLDVTFECAQKAGKKDGADPDDEEE